MTLKRGPLLADKMVASRWTRDMFVTRERYDLVRARIRNARAFVLDDGAVDKIATVMREVPELVVQHQEFARAPFDLMWVEWNHLRMFTGVTGDEPDETADAEVGYLIDHGTVYALAGAKRDIPGHRPGLVPVRYHLHQEWPVADQLAFAERVKTSRIQIDAFAWGETFLKITPEQRAGLRANNIIEPMWRQDLRLTDHEMFKMCVQGSAGDLRTVTAILLMLNRPGLTTFPPEIGSRRSFVAGKSFAFMSHRVVTISLDPIPAIRRLGTPAGEGDSRRRHEVRGHFCHNEGYKRGTKLGCEHLLERDEAATHPEDSWKCKLCAGKRWWRAAHARGDGSKGFVAQVREVVA